MSEEHIIAIRKQDKLNRLASERFRVVDGKVEKYKPVPPMRDIEAVVTAEKIANPGIGQEVPGRGVFLGLYAPVDAQGQSLGKIFNMYAAPENLVDKAGNRTFSYSDTLRHIAALKNWHSHDGTSYRTEKEIFKALADGSYDGGWFIPPREILMGANSAGKFVQRDNLAVHADKGNFRGSFSLAGGNGVSYWTSTRHPTMPYITLMMAARLPSGIGTFYPETPRFACRPVRLELAKSELKP